MVNEQPAVIVTGSSGLIGYAVCNLLVKDGYRVHFLAMAPVRVLDSEVSKAWPISDAGLGAGDPLAARR